MYHVTSCYVWCWMFIFHLEWSCRYQHTQPHSRHERADMTSRGQANRPIYRESQLYELLLPNNQMSGVTIPISSVYIPPLNQMTSYSSLSSSFWTLFLAARRLNKITQRDAIINQGFVCSSPLRNKNPLVSGSVQIIVCNPTLWHASHRGQCVT